MCGSLDSPGSCCYLVLLGIPEAGKADARRVGESTPAGALLSLEGLPNHEPPQENKPAEGTKYNTKKTRSEVRGVFLPTSAEDKNNSDEPSKNNLSPRETKHFKNCRLFVSCFSSVTTLRLSTLQYYQR